jgi:hypothetical protein
VSIRQVAAALVQAYSDMALGLPTAYETLDFAPPAGLAWAALYNVPADLAVASLGDGGQNRYVGFFQIDFHAPENTGTFALLNWADLCQINFRAGRTLAYQGQAVKIIRSVPSSIRRSGNSADYVLSMSIYWRADMNRDGTAGDQTPSAIPSGPQDVQFLFPTPLSQWIVNHNLNRKVTADVYTLGGVKVWANITNVNDNQVQVDFDAPMAGYVIVN